MMPELRCSANRDGNDTQYVRSGNVTVSSPHPGPRKPDQPRDTATAVMGRSETLPGTREGKRSTTTSAEKSCRKPGALYLQMREPLKAIKNAWRWRASSTRKFINN